MNPLSSRRYTQLVDSLNTHWYLIRRYLELRIRIMEKELGDHDNSES